MTTAAPLSPHFTSPSSGFGYYTLLNTWKLRDWFPTRPSWVATRSVQISIHFNEVKPKGNKAVARDISTSREILNGVSQSSKHFGELVSIYSLDKRVTLVIATASPIGRKRKNRTTLRRFPPAYIHLILQQRASTLSCGDLSPRERTPLCFFLGRRQWEED